jgi:type I restriction enzyme S subunit
MGDVPISVPPIEIQRKIGTSLQELELLLTSLEAGLPAEISSRRLQYEHYRNELLTFKKSEVA